MAKVARKKRPELAFQDDGALMGPDQAKLLDQLKQSGGQRVRSNVIYGQVRKNGAYDWAALDQLVNAERARGLLPQLTILGTPRYMPGGDQALSYQHAPPALAGQFAKDVAQHFAGRVGRYSAWNEPNLDTFLKGRSAKQYRAIYQAMRAGIKGVDPRAQVMLGELMPGVSSDPNPGNQAHAANFLNRVFAAGNKPLRSEGLALHPYGFGGEAPGLHGGPNTYLGINQLKQAQHLLAQAQRRHQFTTQSGGRVPLYLTEFGYSRAAVPDATKRAHLLQNAYKAAQGVGAKEMTFYQLAPTPAGGGSWDTTTPLKALTRIRKQAGMVR